jgi:hypothetical protein
LGVYVAPIAPMIAAAWVSVIPFPRLADRCGLPRYVWRTQRCFWLARLARRR